MKCKKDKTFINLDGKCKMETTYADISKPHKVNLNLMAYLKRYSTNWLIVPDCIRSFSQRSYIGKLKSRNSHLSGYCAEQQRAMVLFFKASSEKSSHRLNCMELKQPKRMRKLK